MASSALVNVTDTRANLNDTIANAARAIGRSKDRRKVFVEIYTGKQHWKTRTDIATRTGLKKKRVTEEAKKLFDQHFILRTKHHGELVYGKDPVLYQHKRTILGAAGNKKKLDKIPTKVRPHIVGGSTFRFVLAKSSPKPREITIDEVASFSAVRAITHRDINLKLSKMAEERVKNAFKKIIGETSEFKDWGGERNDLFTNKLRLASKRKSAAFAFKGKATKSPLTPKKMGKNADQIGRLFGSPADVFFVVFHGKVDQSIYEQMRAHAVGNSMSGRAISYGVIDGDDLNRLCQAYPKAFKA